MLMCTLRRRHGTLRLRNDPVSCARPNLHVHLAKPRPALGARQFLLHLLFPQRDASVTVPHRKHLVNSRACLSAVSSFVARCVAQTAKYRIFLSTGTSTSATRPSRGFSLRCPKCAAAFSTFSSLQSFTKALASLTRKYTPQVCSRRRSLLGKNGALSLEEPRKVKPLQHVRAGI